MIRHWLRILPMAACFAAPARATIDPQAAVDYASGELPQRFFKALGAWDLERAEEEWHAMVAASGPDDPLPIYAEGVLRFHQSRYEQADARLRQLDSYPSLDPALRESLSFYRDALKVPLRFRKKESEHFIFHYTDPDAPLSHYVLDLMERIREEMAADFGWAPPEKVVVEAMPSRQAFDDASPLTRKDIDTSGTIAICKYNRLMFTSPRVLHRGYGWQETLAHEYVHYLISRMTRNKVPIWLHEAAAKYQQGRPFGGGMGRTPATLNVLAKAQEEGYFLPFDRMHPSMAKLKSRNDVRLAFAEVSHAFEWMIGQQGYEGIRRLFGKLGGDMEIEPALRAVYGKGFSGIEAELRKFIAAKNYRYDPRIEELPLTFREDINPSMEGEEPSEEALDNGQMTADPARDHARIGDLLRDRDHLVAAAIEYRKGWQASETLSPLLANKLALVEMRRERWDEARKALEAVYPYYPDHSTTLTRLGLIHHRQGRPEKAREFLEKSLAENPFDPEVHEVLAEIYLRLGDAKGAEREQAVRDLLSPPH